MVGTRVTFTRSTNEYADVHSFHFRGPGITYTAGQYIHVHVGGFPSPRSIRELSLASAPHEDELRLTVHVDSGSTFKQRLQALQPGDEIGMFRTGGHLPLPAAPDGRPHVFIGGGVGMAPIRSVALDAARQEGLDLRIIQVQRGPFLYQDDLAALDIDYQPVAPEQYTATVASMHAAAPSGMFHIVGSPRLLTATRAQLRTLGVDGADIRAEVWH